MKEKCQRTPEDHMIFYKLVQNQGVVSVMRAATLKKELPRVVSIGGKLCGEFVCFFCKGCGDVRTPSSDWL